MKTEMDEKITATMSRRRAGHIMDFFATPKVPQELCGLPVSFKLFFTSEKNSQLFPL